ncbi:MAG: hypothetical protein K9M45_01645 [Kiritimatiellales bacterium]|nr:hypothetical protein [Kiritimatiellales bacterium]
MSLGFEIGILILGAILAGLNACIAYILADLKGWLKALNDRVTAHVENDSKHCSPEKAAHHLKTATQ